MIPEEKNPFANATDFMYFQNTETFFIESPNLGANQTQNQ